MEHATTVLIADSAEDFCNALAAALQRSEGFQVVGTAADEIGRASCRERV